MLGILSPPPPQKKKLQIIPCILNETTRSELNGPSLSFSLPAVVVPDGASERSGLADDLGSEEDLLFEEFRTSGHRFGHPGGGGGEQLAINEVGRVGILETW